MLSIKNAVKSKLRQHLTTILNTLIFVFGLRNDMPTIPNTLKSTTYSIWPLHILAIVKRVKAIIPVAYLQPENRISTSLNNPLIA